MKYRNSAHNKKVFTDYVRKRFSGWKIKSIKTIRPAMKYFAGTYEATLVDKKCQYIKHSIEELVHG